MSLFFSYTPPYLGPHHGYTDILTMMFLNLMQDVGDRIVYIRLRVLPVLEALAPETSPRFLSSLIAS